MVRFAPVNLCLSLCLLVSAGLAQDQLSPEQSYSARQTNPVEFDVDYSIVITAPYHTKTLRVWVPMPPSDAAQQITNHSWTTFPDSIPPQIGEESVFGNRFAYFEFDHPQGGQIIRQRFHVKTSELNWHLDPEKMQHVDAWPAEFDKYGKGEAQAVVVDSRFESLLNDIVPRRSNSFTDFSKVLGYVNDSFKYDHSRASLQASAVHALENRTGHCSDYHGFCASMGRLLGTPTRVTYGLNLFPKNSPSHCKLEAFLPPYGWVSFDVSETQKLVQLIAKNETLTEAERRPLIGAAQRRLLSGYRDNTWLLQTRGTDYELAPKASKRVPVVRTIYAEADGVPLPDPDPSDPSKTEHAWMTVMKITPEHEITDPFKDLKHLDNWK